MTPYCCKCGEPIDPHSDSPQCEQCDADATQAAYDMATDEALAMLAAAEGPERELISQFPEYPF